MKWLAVGLAVAFGVAGFALVPGPGAVNNVCVARTSSSPGNLSWRLRQASGLTSSPRRRTCCSPTTTAGSGTAPSPKNPPEQRGRVGDRSDGQALARFRFDIGGTPIPYFDTEAISRDPQGRLVLADTGTNVDGRVTVALYRFTPPPVTAGQADVEGGPPRRG